MQDRRYVLGGAALGLLAVAILAFILFSPRWAVSRFDQLAQAGLGRSVSATGGTHLDFSPLSIRVENIALSGPAAADDSFVTAAAMTIPTSMGALLRRRPDLSTITLTGADFAFLINERGEANWDFPGVTSFEPRKLVLEQARLRYFDARNEQSITLSNIDGIVEIGADGGLTFTGSAVINARVVRIDAELKSLPRVDADGSPLEVALATNDGNASFSGRLSTAKVLSLSGPISLSGTAIGPSLRLLGLPIPDKLEPKGSASVDGVLDSAGRAYAIRNATIALGDFSAQGDVVADLRNERPKLQANFAAETLWLDPFVPAAGAENGDWGRAKLPFGLIKDFDAEVTVEARRLAYGALTTAAAQIKATLTAGKLDVAAAANLPDGGTAKLTVTGDTTSLPPGLAVTVAAENAAAQPLIGALTGATGITGTGSYSAELSATGTTQEEMLGTLKGTAFLSLADGTIPGTDLAGLLAEVRHKILPGWSAAAGTTAFTSLTVEAAISDGIASFRNAALATPQANYTVQGLVDLLRRGLQVSTEASVNGQPALPVPVIARGPWDAPKIYPDIPNILTNPEGGFARLQDPGPPPAAQPQPAQGN